MKQPSTNFELSTRCEIWSICENIIKETEEDEPIPLLSTDSLKEQSARHLRIVIFMSKFEKYSTKIVSK